MRLDDTFRAAGWPAQAPTDRQDLPNTILLRFYGSQIFDLYECWNFCEN